MASSPKTTATAQRPLTADGIAISNAPTAAHSEKTMLATRMIVACQDCRYGAELPKGTAERQRWGYGGAPRLPGSSGRA